MSFTAWLLEKSLSVDNLFVFALIFAYFKVPAKYQHRVLFFGVMGALVFRAIFLALGVQIVETFSPANWRSSEQIAQWSGGSASSRCSMAQVAQVQMVMCRSRSVGAFSSIPVIDRQPRQVVSGDRHGVVSDRDRGLGSTEVRK